jgi:hypothetical protein
MQHLPVRSITSESMYMLYQRNAASTENTRKPKTKGKPVYGTDRIELRRMLKGCHHCVKSKAINARASGYEKKVVVVVVVQVCREAS